MADGFPRRTGSRCVEVGWSRLIFRCQHDGQDALRALHIGGILGAHVRVLAIVVVDLPEDRLAIELEVAEVVLEIRVIVVGEVRVRAGHIDRTGQEVVADSGNAARNEEEPRAAVVAGLLERSFTRG